MFFKTATMSLVSLHFHFFQEFQDFYVLLCLAGTLRDVLSNCQSGNVNVIMWVFFPLSLSPPLSLSDSLSPSLSSLSLWLSLSPSLSLSFVGSLRHSSSASNPRRQWYPVGPHAGGQVDTFCAWISCQIWCSQCVRVHVFSSEPFSWIWFLTLYMWHVAWGLHSGMGDYWLWVAGLPN